MLLDFAMMPASVRLQGAVRGVVLEVLAAAHELAGDPERRVGVRLPLVHDGRQRHELARRSRLEHVRQRAVPAVRVGGGGRLVGIEGRCRREREDLARARVHDDDGAAVRLGLRHSLRDRLLRHVLDVAVEGESHGGAGRRLGQRVRARRDHPTAGSALEGLRPRSPRELLLVGVLDPAEAAAVAAHEADDVRSEVACRIDATRRRLAEDPGQPQLLDAVPRLRGQALGKVDEAPVTGQALGQDRGIGPEDGAELGRDRCRIGDERLVGGEVARLHRHGERVAAAVEDRAALGGQLQRAQPLVERRGGQGLASHGLQLDEAPGEDGQHQAGRDEEDRAATPRVRQGEDARTAPDDQNPVPAPPGAGLPGRGRRTGWRCASCRRHRGRHHSTGTATSPASSEDSRSRR